MSDSPDIAGALGTIQATLLDNPYIPWVPEPKQAAFLITPHLEALYGGAAGPGKSVALLMGALQYVQVPGYAAILFRRTFTDLALPGALIDLSHQWLTDTDAHWNGVQREWRFPSKAVLSFGYMKTLADRYRYQSARFHYIGFDELTDFEERQWEFLIGRIRRSKAEDGIPLRARAATNPNPDSDWVRERFVPIDAQGKRRPQPKGRAYIPAKLEDNPHLDTEAYEVSLAVLDPVTHAMYRHGRWDVRYTAGMVDRSDVELIDLDDVPSNLDLARYWDLASTEPSETNKDPDWSRGALLGRSPTVDGLWIIDLASCRKAPAGVDALMLRTAKNDGTGVRIGHEKEGGASGKRDAANTARLLKGYAYEPISSSKSKLKRARPTLATWGRGEVKVVRARWNDDLFYEWEGFPDRDHDDIVDAVSGADAMLTKPRARIRRL